MKDWVVYPHKYGLVDCSGKALPLHATMMKLSRVMRWPAVVWWSCMGQDALRRSFKLSPNVPALPEKSKSLYLYG